MSYEPTPAPTPAPQSTGNRPGLAIASLILGIITLFAWCLPICGAPLAIAGVITGILGLSSSSRGMAIAGLILSGLGLLLSAANAVAGILMGPQISQMLQEMLRQMQIQP